VWTRWTGGSLSKGTYGEDLDDSEEVEERASGRRKDVWSGESGMMKRNGEHVKGEGVGLDDSNEEGSCPVHVRDLKLRVSKTRV